MRMNAFRLSAAALALCIAGQPAFAGVNFDGSTFQVVRYSTLFGDLDLGSFSGPFSVTDSDTGLELSLGLNEFNVVNTTDGTLVFDDVSYVLTPTIDNSPDIISGITYSTTGVTEGFGPPLVFNLYNTIQSFLSSGTTFEAGGHIDATFAPEPEVVPANPVPEPASWAMLVAGLGLAGGVMRRTRRTAQVVFA